MSRRTDADDSTTRTPIDTTETDCPDCGTTTSIVDPRAGHRSIASCDACGALVVLFG
jgi:transcription elongation factor Elf1